MIPRIGEWLDGDPPRRLAAARTLCFAGNRRLVLPRALGGQLLALCAAGPQPALIHLASTRFFEQFGPDDWATFVRDVLPRLLAMLGAHEDDVLEVLSRAAQRGCTLGAAVPVLAERLRRAARRRGTEHQDGDFVVSKAIRGQHALLRTLRSMARTGTSMEAARDDILAFCGHDVLDISACETLAFHCMHAGDRAGLEVLVQRASPLGRSAARNVVSEWLSDRITQARAGRDTSLLRTLTEQRRSADALFAPSP